MEERNLLRQAAGISLIIFYALRSLRKRFNCKFFRQSFRSLIHLTMTKADYDSVFLRNNCTGESAGRGGHSIRSGATHGRVIACGLISIAAIEICHLIYYTCEFLPALQAASFFELASITFLSCLFFSWRRTYQERAQLVIWTRRGLTRICSVYGLTLLIYPEAYADITLNT